jgi:hypothetical protein
MIGSDMLQGTERHALTRSTCPRGHSVSLLNVSRPSLRDEPFHDLGPASSSRADTEAESVRVPLTRTCELPSSNVPSSFGAIPDHSSTVARVFARKKPTRGEEVRGTEAQFLLSLQSLSPLFHLPLGQAAEQLGLCRTALKNACRKCGLARWPFCAPVGRVHRESTVSPSPPDIARSTSYSHPAGCISPSHSLDAPARVNSLQRARSDASPRSSLKPQSGFLFSSIESSLSAELPDNALSFTAAAAWGVPPAQDGWPLPPPAATSDEWGAGSSTSLSVEAFVGWYSRKVSVAQLELPNQPTVAEDRGCDLSFLCAGLEAVNCTPG